MKYGKTENTFNKDCGTVAQKPDKDGVLNITTEDYLGQVEGLDSLAEVTSVDLGAIDSTDMETNLGRPKPAKFKDMKDRVDIAQTIYKNHRKYDGFVVVHGTDTLVESAAALTYMLPGFRKPIVLTGAQKSAWATGSDAPRNILGAVQTATTDIGEVVISFGNSILRGTRAKKLDEEGYNAYCTPGIEPIGKFIAMGDGMRLGDNRIKKSKFSPNFFIDFDTRVFCYDHVSGSSMEKILFNLAKNKDIAGFTLGGFGAGNIPSKFVPFIEMATKKYKPVVVYTKCDIGAADMGVYAVGAAPLKAGAIPAGDMTPEALGQKLMYALGLARQVKVKGSKKLDFVKSVIQTPFNGDINIR